MPASAYVRATSKEFRVTSHPQIVEVLIERKTGEVRVRVRSSCALRLGADRIGWPDVPRQPY